MARCFDDPFWSRAAPLAADLSGECFSRALNFTIRTENNSKLERIKTIQI